MKRFELKSENDYVDYTIQNYVDCYDDLNEESITRFTELFDALKNHKISIGNTLINNKSFHGVKLEKFKDKKNYRNTDNLKEQLYNLNSTINEKKETLFFKSLVCLCDSIPYLSSTEMFELNNLFSNIIIDKQDLNSPIVNDDTLFYSYNRYPNRKK